MKVIRSVLFDLDGTLLDSKTRFFEAYNETCRQNGFDVLSREDFDLIYRKNRLDRKLPRDPVLQSRFWLGFLRNFTALEPRDLQTPFPGVREALVALRKRGYTMGVVTGRTCPETQVSRELDRMGLLEFFETVRTKHHFVPKEGESVQRIVSKVPVLREAIEQIDFPAKQCAYVGDWVEDVQSSRKVGMGLAVGVTESGFDRDILAAQQPDALLDSVASLPEFLESQPGLIGPDYLRITTEVEWLNEGEEITHRGTVELLSKSLMRDRLGRYWVNTGKERFLVLVDDAPYLVARVALPNDPGQPDAAVRIRLNDGTEESLNPATLVVGAGNVLYCKVKRGDHRARFSRPAYYDLARLVSEDGAAGRFSLSIAGRRHPIRSDLASASGG